MSCIEHFTGIIVPLLTPVDDKGEVDDPSLRRLVDYAIGGNVNAIVALGTTGEFPSLTPEQRRVVLEVVVEQASGRVPVLAGVADCSLGMTHHYIRVAEEVGASAVVAICPYYYSLSDEEVLRYFQGIAETSSLPILVYQAAHVGNKRRFRPELVAELAGLPRVIGLKDSSGDFAFFESIIRVLQEFPSFGFWQGDELLLARSVRKGARGGVNTLANVAPALVAATFQAARVNDERALEGVAPLMQRLYQLYRCKSSPVAAVKVAVNALGYCGTNVLPPLMACPQHEREQIHQIVKDVMDSQRTWSIG